jgi:hypothetical protein
VQKNLKCNFPSTPTTVRLRNAENKYFFTSETGRVVSSRLNAWKLDAEWKAEQSQMAGQLTAGPPNIVESIQRASRSGGHDNQAAWAAQPVQTTQPVRAYPPVQATQPVRATQPVETTQPVRAYPPLHAAAGHAYAAAALTSEKQDKHSREQKVGAQNKFYGT